MQNQSVLNKINHPRDVKCLDREQLPTLCNEIRAFLIDNISKTGGHLASNLGVVEISVGVHRVFSSPKDSILFDVGHQSYVHKMLTGRKDRFDTLRTYDGLSGFMRPEESEHDAFISGHASNSVSAALGIARAKRLTGDDSSTVCILGDGAMTGGMVYEALNDAGRSKEPIIIVFNDNEMSIGRNVGALAERLSKLRTKPSYFEFKGRVKSFLSFLPGGQWSINFLSRLKNNFKKLLLKETIFEILGFKYLGPSDGNDVNNVCHLLNEAKKLKVPVVVHFKTVKGKGYQYSEDNPDEYHGVSAFDIASGQTICGSGKNFSSVFGDCLSRLAEKDKKICAVTAAMEMGTGLCGFAKAYPERFFDVGITEEHAVTMAAGMASRDFRPVCAIYSTFLQRSYDQLIHDVAIDKQHVVFGVDRSGLCGEDGQTHQGVFDTSYLLSVPNMTVLAPASYAELESALYRALYEESGPVAVKYPRGSQGLYTEDGFPAPAVVLRPGKDITIVTYGILTNEALKACEQLAEDGIEAEIIKVNDLTGFDLKMLRESVAKTGKLIVLEDSIEAGSFGERTLSQLLRNGGALQFCRLLNLKQTFVPEGKVPQLWQAYGIDAQAVFACVLEAFNGGKEKA